MPYNRTTRSRRPYSARTTSVVKRLNRITRMIKPEMMEYQTSAGGVADNVGLINSISSLPQGNDNGQRKGNTIRVTSLHIRGFISGIAGQSRVNRVMVVADKQNLGSNPAPEDILDYMTTSLCPVSPIDADRTPRWKVLFDRNIITDDATGQRKLFQKFIKMNHLIHYTGTTANDLFTGQLYMLVCSDQPATNSATVSSICRISYYDA